MTLKKKDFPFQNGHELKYGLKISSRDPITNKVTACSCCFCVVYGRESKLGSKRKATNNIKYFQKFRTDHYLQHLEKQHSIQWKIYSNLQNEDDKKQFFLPKPTTPIRLPSPLRNETTMHFLINKSIVEDILRDLLLLHSNEMHRSLDIFFLIEDEMMHQKDSTPTINHGSHSQHHRQMLHYHQQQQSQSQQQQQQSQSQQPQSQQSQSQSDYHAKDDDDHHAKTTRDMYFVEIKTLKKLSSFVKFLSSGLPWKMTSSLLDSLKKGSFENSTMDPSFNEMTAFNYASIAIAMNLQTLSDILSMVWTFTIFLDCTTLFETNSLDVRLRFNVNNKLYNFHLFAIPHYDQHTVENMFQWFQKFMNAFFSSWTNSILCVSHNGVGSIVQTLNELAQRIQQISQPGMIQVWYGLHPLEFAIQKVFTNHLQDQFYFTLTCIISHLRRQTTLIQTMQSTCPKIKDWTIVGIAPVTSWLTKHAALLQSHFHHKHCSFTPSTKWWVFLFAFNTLIQEAQKVHFALKGLSTAVSKQHAQLTGLLNTYCQITGTMGPMNNEQLQQIERSKYAISGFYVCSHKHAQSFLEGLGYWVTQTLQNMKKEETHVLSIDVAKMFVQTVHEISQILPLHGSTTITKMVELPPVLPHELVQMDMRQFSNVMNLHVHCLQNTFTLTEIDTIGSEFALLLRQYKENPEFQKTVNNMKMEISTTWQILGKPFQTLAKFCGGLATCYPTPEHPVITTTNSEVSFIELEKDIYTKDGIDFSLETTLHCQQYDHIKAIGIPIQDNESLLS